MDYNAGMLILGKILNLYPALLMTGRRPLPFLDQITARSDRNWESELSGFWESARSTDRTLKFHLLANPLATAKAAQAMINLAPVDARLGHGREADMVRSTLKRRCLCRIFTLADTGACILPIPAEGSRYSLGANRQTLRRKVRAAEKAGIVCRSVTDEAEQEKLLAELRDALAVRSDERYREENADHSVFLGVKTWTVAYSAAGEPLVIAVTPRDDQWAVLGLFLSFGETAEHSDARYLLTKALVERLSDDGVRYLIDTRGPSELSNGLRHFQRMIGFRIGRVRVLSRDSESANSGLSRFLRRFAR